MKIVTFNLNGVRSALTKGLQPWLNEFGAEVWCFQEIKIDPLAAAAVWPVFDGWHLHAHHAQKKGYSGVAVLSREQPLTISHGMGIEEVDAEGRVLLLEFEKYRLINAYFPSGTTGDVRQMVKDRFLEQFVAFLDSIPQDKPLVIVGDFNICNTAIDIHNPVSNKNTSGFLPHEREWVSALLASGYVDTWRHLNPELKKYSWWSQRANSRDKNLGWRIDYILCSQSALTAIQASDMLNDIKMSDHCPVWTDFCFT